MENANGFCKCESISDNQHWISLDTPEVLCMLILKSPRVLLDRWKKKVKNIRAATFSQVISIFVVPIRGKHSDSDEEVKTFALLDICRPGLFVTEDLISKLGEEFNQH